MKQGVGGLTTAVSLVPGQGERCLITDDAVVSLRLDVGLRPPTLDVREAVGMTS